jgi:hypothetical protein
LLRQHICGFKSFEEGKIHIFLLFPLEKIHQSIGGIATTSQQETQPETVEPGTLGPALAAVGLAPLDPAGASASAGGSFLVATTTLLNYTVATDTVH